MNEFFAMGGHAVFIWPAYAIVAVVMAGMWLQSWKALNRSESELQVLQAQSPRQGSLDRNSAQNRPQS